MKHQEKSLTHYLTYCNYKANREASPEVTPEQWRVLFGDKTDALEEQYQTEQMHAQIDRAHEAHKQPLFKEGEEA
jgi:hypothetical protein